MSILTRIANRFRADVVLSRLVQAQGMAERIQAMTPLPDHAGTDRRIVPRMIEILATDDDSFIRFNTASVMERFATTPIDADQRELLVSALQKAFWTDADYAVRGRAAESLHVLGYVHGNTRDEATSAAMRKDLDLLRKMLADARRGEAIHAVAEEIRENRSLTLIDLVEEVHAADPEIIDAIEALIAARERIAAGSAKLGADAARLGFDPAAVSAGVQRASDEIIGRARHVLAAIGAASTPRGVLRRVTGRSLFYRCPGCGVTLRKRSIEGIADAFGFTSCSECKASFSYQEVYEAGIHDLPEVEGACGACGAVLRGPEMELLGKPCPSCEAALPAVAQP